MEQEFKKRLLPEGTLEDLKLERQELLETAINLRVDFEHPLKTLTDFLKLQSDFNSINSVLESHEDAISQLTVEENSDE